MKIEILKHYYNQELCELQELPEVLHIDYLCDGEESTKSVATCVLAAWVRTKGLLEATDNVIRNGEPEEVSFKCSFDDWFFELMENWHLEYYIKETLKTKTY